MSQFNQGDAHISETIIWYPADDPPAVMETFLVQRATGDFDHASYSGSRDVWTVRDSDIELDDVLWWTDVTGPFDMEPVDDEPDYDAIGVQEQYEQAGREFG